MVVTKVVLMDRLHADSCFVTVQESARNLSIKTNLIVTLKKIKVVSIFSGQVPDFCFDLHVWYPTFSG